MRALLAGFLLLALPAQAHPVVVEMFTSLACSSCTPADNLLASLAKNPGILPLSFNVSYWNSPAFTDPYALQAATDRQTWYAGLRHGLNVYTPEAVVDGTAQMVGSDRAKLTTAIAAAKASPAGNVPITITGGRLVTIKIGAGAGGATIWMFGYDSKHTIALGGGENAGTTVTEINVVRSIANLGPWSGPEMSMSFSHPAGQHVAVVVQTPTGAVIATAAV